MLTQSEIDLLINMLKRIVDRGTIDFPGPGGYKQLDVESESGKEKFIIDINRKGIIKISKCTYQERYRKDEILLRLDINGPPHTNPNGQEIDPNHLHIYREGFGDAWAYYIPANIFTNTGDMVTTLIDFLEYCKIINVSEIPIQGGFFS